MVELTAELLREMIESLASQPGEPAGRHEQRRGPRAPAEAEATLLPFSDAFADRAVQVPIRNLSRGGFRFLYERPLPLGEVFGLALPEDGAPPTVLQCAVTHWQPLSPRLYAIGASFTRILKENGPNLGLLLDPQAQEARQAS